MRHQILRAVVVLNMAMVCAGSDALARKCADNPVLNSGTLVANGMKAHMMDSIQGMTQWARKPDGSAGIEALFHDCSLDGMLGQISRCNAIPLLKWDRIAGDCSNCHWKTQSATSTHDYGITPAEKFNTCSNCHSPQNLSIHPDPLMIPPDWLDFTKKENLMRVSYYLAGKTKAEASLLRAMDGTMPPGSAYHDLPGAGYVGWCEEIQDMFQNWINAGYP